MSVLPLWLTFSLKSQWSFPVTHSTPHQCVLKVVRRDPWQTTDWCLTLHTMQHQCWLWCVERPEQPDLCPKYSAGALNILHIHEFASVVLANIILAVEVWIWRNPLPLACDSEVNGTSNHASWGEVCSYFFNLAELRVSHYRQQNEIKNPQTLKDGHKQ